MNFATNIFTSIAASGVISLFAFFLARSFRKQFVIILSRLFNTGVEYVYKNDAEAAEDMRYFSMRSDTVKVFSMRAYRLLHAEAPLRFLMEPNCQIRKIQILLADPNSKSAKARSEEFVNIDHAFTQERYQKDLDWSINQVAQCASKSSRITLRKHGEPAFIRLLITEDYLFLSFFGKVTHGDQSSVFRVARISPLYESIARYFDWVWSNRSSEVLPPAASELDIKNTAKLEHLQPYSQNGLRDE